MEGKGYNLLLGQGWAESTLALTPAFSRFNGFCRDAVVVWSMKE
jgi:hypothetical protein